MKQDTLLLISEINSFNTVEDKYDVRPVPGLLYFSKCLARKVSNSPINSKHPKKLLLLKEPTVSFCPKNGKPRAAKIFVTTTTRRNTSNQYLLSHILFRKTRASMRLDVSLR